MTGSIFVWTSARNTKESKIPLAGNRNGLEQYLWANSTGFSFFVTTRRPLPAASSARIDTAELWSPYNPPSVSIFVFCQSVSLLILRTVQLISCSLRFGAYKRNTDRPTSVLILRIVYLISHPIRFFLRRFLTSCLLPVMTITPSSWLGSKHQL